MKAIHKILMTVAAVAAVQACSIDQIEPYKLENSAISFKSRTNPFSLRGVMDSTIVLDIPIELIGVMTDYDREINLSVADDSLNTAVEGKDFRIIKKTLDKNICKGYVQLEVKNLPEGVPSLQTTLQIKANDNFIDGVPSESKTIVLWSKDYVRPEEGVWRYWYTYFSQYYSKAYHELLLNICGDDIEISTSSKTYVKQNPNLIFQMPTWWYAKTRLFYDAVATHDAEHPDEPYMHSSDVMKYTSYQQAVADGDSVKPAPTILETLKKL